MFFGMFKGRNEYGFSFVVFSFASFFMLSGLSSVSHVKSSHEKPQKKSMIAQMDIPEGVSFEEDLPEEDLSEVSTPQEGALQRVEFQMSVYPRNLPERARDSNIEMYIPQTITPEQFLVNRLLPQNSAAQPAQEDLSEVSTPQAAAPQEVEIQILINQPTVFQRFLPDQVRECRIQMCIPQEVVPQQFLLNRLIHQTSAAQPVLSESIIVAYYADNDSSNTGVDYDSADDPNYGHQSR